MNARVERQLRLALHAFPTRWRTERGDELVATATEMLPPDVERVPPAVLVDIVRAGWGERLRRHPPLWRWLHYCLGGKLPARWHAWVSDDLDGRWYWLRAALRRYVTMAGTWSIAWATMDATSGTNTPMPLSGLVGFAVLFPLSFFMVGRFRRQVRKQHGLTAAGGAAPATGDPVGADARRVAPGRPGRGRALGVVRGGGRRHAVAHQHDRRRARAPEVVPRRRRGGRRAGWRGGDRPVPAHAGAGPGRAGVVPRWQPAPASSTWPACWRSSRDSPASGGSRWSPA